jgi:hypothetical protein
MPVSNFQNYNQQIEAIRNRLGGLEDIFSSSATEMRNVKTEFEGRLSACEADLNRLKLTLPAAFSTPSPTPLSPSPVRVSTPIPVPPPPSPAPKPKKKPKTKRSLPRSPRGVEFPLKKAKSLDGIISYLTRKHGGNVDDKGIVAITSKSVLDDHPDSAARNLANLTPAFWFESKYEPAPMFTTNTAELFTTKNLS